MAAATPRPSASTPATPARKTGQSLGDVNGTKAVPNKLEALVKAMEDIELADQHDLNVFCEAGRKLSHYLAVATALASGELEAGAKEMAKNNKSGWGSGFKIKRVTKRLNNAADHFASAAADFVGAWTTFEQVFADLLEGAETKTKTHKRFTIK